VLKYKRFHLFPLKNKWVTSLQGRQGDPGHQGTDGPCVSAQSALSFILYLSLAVNFQTLIMIDCLYRVLQDFRVSVGSLENQDPVEVKGSQENLGQMGPRVFQ